MLKETIKNTPQLQAPGMGLPKIELYIARMMVAVKLRTTSVKKASEIFTSETKEILALIDRVHPDLASQRVLIDRIRGLEDSSRYWSLYMTIEHLNIVNKLFIDVIQSLLNGVKPKILVSTADVKPTINIDKEVVSIFKSNCQDFQSLFPPDMNFNSKLTLAHPWFGELNAQEWHFFAGFHMRLHRKQMLRIIEKL